MSEQQSVIRVMKRGQQFDISIHDVVMIRAEDKYAVVVTTTDEFLCPEPLLFFENTYPEALLRVHRNALVAYSQIDKMVHEPLFRRRTLFLKHKQTKVLVSRRQAPALRAHMRGFAKRSD